MEDLLNLMNSTKELTIITGERRRLPVQRPSDILLAPAWTDFVHLGKLPHAQRNYVVPDQLYAEDWTNKNRDRDLFKKEILGVGAPDVNFAVLDMNNLALFRFVLNRETHNKLIPLFHQVHGQPFVNRAEFLLRHHEELDRIVGALCPTALIDPFAEEFQRSERIARTPHGLISLAGHPYGASSPCFLAGGITGPTTAGAVKLLTGVRIYDPKTQGFADLSTRPFGGVFRRRHPSKLPPYDILQIEEDLEWVTPSYTAEQILKRLADMREATNLSTVQLTKDDVDRMITLVESVSRLRALQDCPTTGKLRVMILTGGLGTRMKDFTGGRSKAELPILHAVLGTEDQRRGETVLEVLVRTLVGTGLVSDLHLLISSCLLPRHR